MSTSSAKRRFDMQSLFFITQFDAQALIFDKVSLSLSLSSADWRTELKKRLLKGLPCFVP